MHEFSNQTTLSEKEHGRFLSLMKTKSELKTFDDEIAAKVEDK